MTRDFETTIECVISRLTARRYLSRLQLSRVVLYPLMSVFPNPTFSGVVLVKFECFCASHTYKASANGHFRNALVVHLVQ